MQKPALMHPWIIKRNGKGFKNSTSNIMRPSFTMHNCPPGLLGRGQHRRSSSVCLSVHSGAGRILRVFVHIRSILLLLLFLGLMDGCLQHSFFSLGFQSKNEWMYVWICVCVGVCVSVCVRVHLRVCMTEREGEI